MADSFLLLQGREAQCMDFPDGQDAIRGESGSSEDLEHRYFSIVENRRVRDGRVLQRHVLYLGEINSSQELAWRKSIDVLEEGITQPRTLALFPEDRCEDLVDGSIVRLKLSQLRLAAAVGWMLVGA